jgi:hypothetical protein
MRDPLPKVLTPQSSKQRRLQNCSSLDLDTKPAVMIWLYPEDVNATPGCDRQRHSRLRTWPALDIESRLTPIL